MATLGYYWSAVLRLHFQLECSNSLVRNRFIARVSKTQWPALILLLFLLLLVPIINHSHGGALSPTHCPGRTRDYQFIMSRLIKK